MPLKTNGARLRELRELKLLTQTEFAKEIDYHPNYVSDVERGVENAGRDFIEAAARVLECDFNEFIDGVVPRRRTERKAAS